MDIVIDYGVGTYDLDARAVFKQDDETYSEVLVFHNFAVTYSVHDGFRVGTQQGLANRDEYREFVKYLGQVSQNLDECDCEDHYNVTSTLEFFGEGQDIR